MRLCFGLLLISLLLAAGARARLPGRELKKSDDLARTFNRIAETYVKLALAVGQHDGDYVDAYYGPPAWAAEAKRQPKRPLPELKAAADNLAGELNRVEVTNAAEMVRLRREYLIGQLRAMSTRLSQLQGTKLSFDEEAKALYDAAAPRHSAEHFERVLTQVERLLPGAGPLAERYDRYRQSFIIPKERLAPVFQAAIAEARQRTARHIQLPAGESFELEFVTGKSWSGYNWYKGNSHSLIQINTDLPIYIDRAVDLGAHEGYPGHHVYNVLLEQRFVKERGWVEFSVYPLFSPQSLIAEGSANFGIEVAFPGAERLRFERDVLYPLAGLNPAGAEKYDEVQRLAGQLNYAGNEAARRYLNGEIDAAEAARWLTRYGLMSEPRARQRVQFMEKYRSYVINYNLGQDLVREYIERRGGTAAHPEKRWEEFGRLLASPRLPSGLK